MRRRTFLSALAAAPVAAMLPAAPIRVRDTEGFAYLESLRIDLSDLYDHPVLKVWVTERAPTSWKSAPSSTGGPI